MPYLTRYGLPLPFVLLAVLTRLPGLQSYATLWKDVQSGVWWVYIIYAQHTLQVLAEMHKFTWRACPASLHPPGKVLRNTYWARASSLTWLNHCRYDGLEWSGNETHPRRSELLRWRNLSLTSVTCKSKTPSHSSGKLCSYDSEGRSGETPERGGRNRKIPTLSTQLLPDVFKFLHAVQGM